MHVIYFTCTLDKEEVGKCVLPKLMYASYTKSSYGNKVNTVVWHNVTSHQGLHCLVQQKKLTAKAISYAINNGPS